MGCLLSLVLFAGAIVYGGQIGKIYWRYYELLDEMRESARFARSRSDDAIRRNLRAVIDELGLPEEAKRVQVRRAGPPYSILISTQYQERLDLPVGRPIYLSFRPKAESRF
ncbi:MAG: hypothetical protein H6R40_1065 [Gemmatimonadetes bacterium]|nr:hypothetical protein [Gemmatimonadota bacterium]